MLALLDMESLQYGLIALGGYIALISLVRLMKQRQEAILDELSREVELEKKRRKAQKRRQEQRKLREQLRHRRTTSPATK